MMMRKRAIMSSNHMQKSKPLRCPVCSKRQLFILLLGEERGKLKQCKNCGYKHKDDAIVEE